MLIFLICKICSQYQEFEYLLYGNYSYKLLSFGFFEHTNFSFIIESNDKITTNMYLTKRYDVKTNFKVFQSPSKRMEWNGTINSKGIYFLFISKLEPKFHKINIKIDFKNKKTFLDFRDYNMVFSYQIFYKFYFFIWIIWLLNSVFYQDFKIKIHRILGFTSLIRCILLFITSLNLIELGNSNKTSKWKSILIFVLKLMYFFLFFHENLLISLGYCIFRTKISIKEHINIFCSSLCLSVSISLFDIFEQFISSFILLIFTFFNIMWYAKNLIINYISILYLLKLTNNEQKLNSKVNLVYKYISIFFKFFILIIVASFFLLIFEIRYNICLTIFELGLIICSFIQQYYFLYRSSYSGKNFNKLFLNVTVFNEPKCKQMFLLSRKK